MEQKEMVFNPEANYMWKREDVFEIIGKQLETLFQKEKFDVGELNNLIEST
jgi:predicted nucleic-acid-binding protein